MPTEPAIKRAITFIDGQNLFYAVREAFGYTFPNYDVAALSKTVCQAQGWTLNRVRFYTGIPNRQDDAFWNHFWSAKLRAISWQGGHVFSRPLRYRNKAVRLPDGTQHAFPTAEEKGIDVRIAPDVIRSVHRNECDVTVIFSQDRTFPRWPTRSARLPGNKAVGSRWRAPFRAARHPETAGASTGPIGSTLTG